MRLVLAAACLLAVAGTRGGCGESLHPAHHPCGDKACAKPCHLCAPDDQNCAETAELKICDQNGRCVSPGQNPDLSCPAPGPCAGQACGASCVWNLPCWNAGTCMMPMSPVGSCTADGTCLPGQAVCP